VNASFESVRNRMSSYVETGTVPEYSEGYCVGWCQMQLSRSHACTQKT